MSNSESVLRVFPGLVTTDEQGRKMVEYEGLIAPLIEAVKELDARVRALEAKMADDVEGTASLLYDRTSPNPCPSDRRGGRPSGRPLRLFRQIRREACSASQLGTDDPLV